MDEFIVEVALVLNTTAPLSWTVEAVNSDPTSTLPMPLCRETHRILRVLQVSAKLWC